MYDELTQKRVVVRRDDIARVDVRIPANPWAAWQTQVRDSSGRRAKIVFRVFGVDPALDRCPRSVMSFWRKGRGSPAAILICCLTRSMPVTISVTGCST